MKTLEENLNTIIKNGKINLVDLELVSLSYPVVGKCGDKITDRFFISANQPKAERRRPFAAVELDAETGRLLKYTDCSAEDFAKDTGVGLNDEINYAAPSSCGYRELVKIKKRLSDLYESVRAFAFSENISDEQKKLLNEYNTCFGKLVNDDLKKFYTALSPEFFGWIEVNI